MRVLVLGAAGQLGAATVTHWQQSGHEVHGSTRADLDITDHEALHRRVAQLRSELVINCSAYNRVDDAEGDPSTALAVNTWAVRAMARACAAVGATFVHYSTDFVFDGRTDRPYVETDAPNPQSTYGSSKLMGEWFAAQAPRHYVLRVESLFGGAAARSSVDKMIEAFRSRQSVTAFADRMVSPSYVRDVAEATLLLVTADIPVGLYHCVNSGQATWPEVAEALRDWLGCPHVPIHGVPAASVPLRAARPLYAALSPGKLASMGIPMRPWHEALREYVK